MKRPWPFSFAEKNSHEDGKQGNKQNVYLEGKVHRHMVDSESHTCGNLIHLYAAFLLGFLWLIIFIFMVLSPYMVYLRILPCIPEHLSAKMDSTKEAYGLVGLASFPFWPPRNFLVGRVSLTLRIRNLWSLIWAGPSLLLQLSCYWHFGVSVHKEWTYPPYLWVGGHLPPATFLF